MKFNSQKGQIGTMQLLAIAGSVLVALIGGFFGQSSRTDTRLETVKAEQTANVLAISQRVTSSEVKVENLEKKVDEIRGDVKELLRRIK